MYHKNVYTRADENGTVFYFSAEDFKGLLKEPFSFVSSRGHRMQGYLYSYKCPMENHIVIFEHGMGSGHRGYMKEIELLARHGFLVFAYDHTGCMESGGETTGGFSQSLMDLDDAIMALKNNEAYRDCDISVVGHSWGALSALNITAIHPDIRHIVAISGPISVQTLLKQLFGGFLWRYGKHIYEKEKAANPKYIAYDALSTLEKTKAKVLIVHSDDDAVVSCKNNFDVMQKALSNRENITFLKVSGKGHNPNYTAEAVKYKDSFFAIYQTTMKKNLLKTDADKKAFISRFDWHKMTEQDMDVWKKMFEVLDS